jgi:hypothetical protein
MHRRLPNLAAAPPAPATAAAATLGAIDGRAA